jgi:hypothetical protein
VRQQYRFMSICFWSLAACAVAAAALINIASAQDLTGAANAFSRAQKAELSGDHATAAELFELADSLVPSPEALRSALRSRIAAGHMATAALHAEALSSRYPDDTRSKELVDAALELAAKTLMRFEVECQPHTCAVLIDGAAATVETAHHHLFYIESGKHEVIAAFGNTRSEPQFAEGEPGARGSLSFSDAPPPEPNGESAGAGASVSKDRPVADSSAPKNGLPRGIFLAGVAVTVGLGVATVWSSLDVLRLYEQYKKNQTPDAYDEGRDKEKRTNILIAATAAAAVTTGVIAIFTRWKSDGGSGQHNVRAAVGVVPNGGLASVSGSF